ncbi:hypothetical protein Nocox_41520 [Nonomuraea coxensis DSM 45129]|uniref:Uncharacterized protein n=2 Tax=Nonomuraea coxensis TaxID=404386 RepID=A0ABX8UEA2_9ACTN|nr:hypothetical protein Nocox_41520 [Nonomuraea coxensis DSM 45129]
MMRLMMTLIGLAWICCVPYLLATELVLAAVMALPLTVFGVAFAVRAPIWGVTCDEEVIKVHRFFSTRRVPVGRATGIRRTWSGGAEILWRDERRWPKWARITAFSTGLTTSRAMAGFLREHNEASLDALKLWMERHATAPRPR